VVVIAICLFVAGCGDNPVSNGENDSNGEQLVLAWAQHSSGYWQVRADYIDEPVTMLSGSIFASPVPSLESVEFNGHSFTGEDVASYEAGFVAFGDWAADPIAISSGFDAITVAVATTLGEVEGALALPDTIASLQVSEADTIDIGESLGVWWGGSDADFYRFSLSYQYVIPDSGVFFTWVDSLVVGESIAVDGAFFAWDGEVTWVDVTPINGPLPRVGVNANMSGSGSGFLHYANKWQSFPLGIAVGDGLSRDEGVSGRRHCREDVLPTERMVAARLMSVGVIE
jgi:hypothetical protein